MHARNVMLGLAAWSASFGLAFGWGQEGHSVIAEIAQRRLSPAATAAVETILGKGHSLASVSSWADDQRAAHPDSYNWHFVDIPIADNAYDPAKECKPSPKGDCTIGALERLKVQLRCADDASRLDALRFAVHLVGDLHQPLHTVDEARGGNDIAVTVTFKGTTCFKNCDLDANFHQVWDTTLLQRTAFDWGADVDRIEAGFLKSPEAQDAAATGGTATDWLLATHVVAQGVWADRPADNVLDEAYLTAQQPILDKQLGLGGLHLAAWLNDTFAAPAACPAN
jgi:nuclease S1